jgi:hypothetical protein
MKNSKQQIIKTISKHLFILGFLFLITACNEKATEVKKDTAEVEDVNKFNDIIWNVKVILPDGKTSDIKAIDKEGKTFDIKAIQNSDQDSFLDIKAMVGGQKLAVKILVSNDKFAPIKAIEKNKTAYDIVAISPEGEKMEVKGIVRSGNIVIIKAIDKEGKFYSVKAISPSGQMNNVKGIKINIKEKEMTMKGFDVHAHVKAMHPSANEDDFKPTVIPKQKSKKKDKNEFKRIIWNIKAVTLKGEKLEVKAFDIEGNKFDVKATQDAEQHSFMNIKAFVNGSELPVKILVSEDEYTPVKAIGRDGTIYDIKALTKDGIKLDIKGISRSGNLIHVKAIYTNGDMYGIKAFAPNGELNDVKGIKIFERTKELSIRGNDVYAHLKAIKQ